MYLMCFRWHCTLSDVVMMEGRSAVAMEHSRTLNMLSVVLYVE